MNWDAVVEETVQRKRERTHLSVAMIAGDSMAITGVLLAFSNCWIGSSPFPSSFSVGVTQAT
jgi:hypothetical protein